MFGANAESVVIALFVCFGFLVLSNFLSEEAKENTGVAKGVLGTVATTMNITTSIMMGIAIFVLIGIIVDLLSGGISNQNNNTNPQSIALKWS